MTKRLNTADSLMIGDQIVLYRGNCTDYRGIPIDTFKNEIINDIPIPEFQTPVVQHYNPNSDFTLRVENHKEGTYLLLNPTTGINLGAITLPDSAEVMDKQELLFSCSQQITNLTVNGNGAVVIGAPNAISATAFFKLKFDKLSGTWYRVG